jgi:hypothetical protein
VFQQLQLDHHHHQDEIDNTLGDECKLDNSSISHDLKFQTTSMDSTSDTTIGSTLDTNRLKLNANLDLISSPEKWKVFVDVTLSNFNEEIASMQRRIESFLKSSHFKSKYASEGLNAEDGFSSTTPQKQLLVTLRNCANLSTTIDRYFSCFKYLKNDTNYPSVENPDMAPLFHDIDRTANELTSETFELTQVCSMFI